MLWLSLSKFHSVAPGASLVCIMTLATGIGGPWLGILLDRRQSPGRVLALSLAGYALALVMLTLTMGVVPQWESMGLALGMGAAMAAASGGWSSQVLLGESLSQRAWVTGLDAMTYNAAGLLGPTMAGVLYTVKGPRMTLGAMVVFLVTAIWFAWSLPKGDRGVPPLARVDMREALWSGYQTLLSNAPLRYVTLVSSISYCGFGMLWTIMPVLAQIVWGRPAYSGILLSILALGAFFGTVSYLKGGDKEPDTLVGVTTLVMGGGTFALIFVRSLPSAIMAALIIGWADGAQLAAVLGVRNRVVARGERGQAFTATASVKILGVSLGVFIGGHLVAMSLPMGITAATLVQLLAASVQFLRKRQDQQSP